MMYHIWIPEGRFGAFNGLCERHEQQSKNDHDNQQDLLQVPIHVSDGLKSVGRRTMMRIRERSIMVKFFVLTLVAT